MLENLAFQFVILPENVLFGIESGLIISGAIVAALFSRQQMVLKRVPYFVWMATLVLFTNFTEVIWFGTVAAISNGFLWILVFAKVTLLIAIGYGSGVIAMGRSRDAYGHAKLAFLHFIPIAIFWLLFTRSKNQTASNQRPESPFLIGPLGVIFGIILFVGAVSAGNFITRQTEQILNATEAGEPLMGSVTALFLNTRGLEETISMMASEIPPGKIDDTLELVGAVSDGSTLTYIYRFTIDISSRINDLKADMITNHCNNQTMLDLMDAGAVLEYKFTLAEDIEIGTLRIDKSICEG